MVISGFVALDRPGCRSWTGFNNLQISGSTRYPLCHQRTKRLYSYRFTIDQAEAQATVPATSRGNLGLCTNRRLPSTLVQTTSGLPLIHTLYQQATTMKACASSQGLCLKVHCTSGKVLGSGECIRTLNQIRGLVYKLDLWLPPGHVAKEKDNRWTKRCTEWQPRAERRDRGRPKVRWMDDIRRAAGPQWQRKAQDRKKMDGICRGLHPAVALSEPRVAHLQPTHYRLPSSTGSFTSFAEVFSQVGEYFVELVCPFSITIFLPNAVDGKASK
ncbi:endonuclease-reverse transcriptase [Plakobranchus ocellatus]|uniref:Endonuclease-reverse transcriptase n=1 Tax=Plakobranchus ocellatus TaxID=259542 RepID=A0AAV4CIT1_9GAST|nr:endonuclease-reverse transcriptase [Plakobranchus ocellatus]